MLYSLACVCRCIRFCIYLCQHTLFHSLGHRSFFYRRRKRNSPGLDDVGRRGTGGFGGDVWSSCDEPASSSLILRKGEKEGYGAMMVWRARGWGWGREKEGYGGDDGEGGAGVAS